MFNLEKISTKLGFPVESQETAKQLFRIYYKGYAQWCLANGVKEVIAPWALVPKLWACFELSKEAQPEFDGIIYRMIEAFTKSAAKLKKPEVNTTFDFEEFNLWERAYDSMVELAKFNGTTVNRAVFSYITSVETGVTKYSMTVYKEKAHYTKKRPYEFAKIFKKQLNDTGVNPKDLVPNKAKLDSLFGFDFKLNTLYDEKGLLSFLCYSRDSLLFEYNNRVQSALSLDREALNKFYHVCNEVDFPYLDPSFWLSAIEGANTAEPKQFLDSLLETPKSVNDFTRTQLPAYVSRGVVAVPKPTAEQIQVVGEVTEAITKATARLYHLAYNSPAMLRVFPVETYLSNGKEATSLDQWFSRLDKAIQNHKIGYLVLKDEEVLGREFLPEDSQDAAFVVKPKHRIMASIGDWNRPRDVEFIPYTSYTARLSLYDFIPNWSDINKAYKLPINLKNIQDYITKYDFK